uniref:inactive serine/threonine-protein kinase TEX14-like n=1 Tax=Solea senegalensis TaxID=28829 RepID=UPI001CD8EB68|nr:inactive serine/threonine-protein kinase TEX14-like [Solea senegalensis]
MTALPFLYPVDVGVVTSGGLHALLHKYTLEGNLSKLKKLLQTGVDVDCVNHLGQTPLFCAALLGHVKVTELLLHYGADPNHCCEDWSTPVHAGVFSCNASVVSDLLDAGGDLRLHDMEGRTPFDWLRAVKQSDSAQMVAFLENCMSSMQQLCQNPTTKKLYGRHMSTSILLQRASLLDRIKTSAIDMQFNKKKHITSPYTTALCLGFGKVCVTEPCQAFAWPASIPLIKESDLTQADDEPVLTFTCGSLTSMTNCSWRHSRVTVKKMMDSRAIYLDLLIKEQEYCSQLLHPQLLQLMGVSLSDDLQKTSLVFERVTVGTLHNLLHNRRTEFPVLQEKWLLSVMLQVCEGLQYLHGQGLVMRALSSHGVVLTELTVAKLTDLGFMVPSKGSSCVKPPKHIALPPSLYRWAAPEVFKQKPCTVEADIYSLCALIQEVYTDNEPWGAVSLDMIKKAMDAGQVLAVNSSIPQPYYDVVLTGLQQHPQDRTYSLHCLCQILQQDIKCLSPEDQLGGGELSDYPEQDLGSGIQTTTQHRIVGKPVKHVVFSTVKPVKMKAVVDRQSHQDRQLHKQWYSGATSELWTERVEFSEEESVHHQVDTHTESESETDSSEEQPDVEENIDREILEQLEILKLPKPTADQQINTFVVDLKVSQELLRQANQSLDTVEDHLDFRDAPSSIHTVSSSAPSMFPLSTNHPGEGTAAAGRHSNQYSLLTQRGNDWSKNLEAQLQDRNWELMSEVELDLWLRHYPAEQQHFEQDRLLQLSSDCDMAEFYSVKTHHSEMELSQMQQSTSSQESADVTGDACRPAAASGNPPMDSHRTNYESFSNTCKDPGVSGTQTQYKPNAYMASSDVALLAELSSITCSPAVPQEKLYSIYSNRQGPPCNSTPRNSDLHRRVMTDIMKAKLPDFPACSHRSTEHLWTESSSIPKASSSKGSYTPLPQSLEADTASSLQGFITAIQGEELFRDSESPSSSFHRCYSNSVEGEHKEEENRESAGVSEQGQSEEETERSTDSQNVMDEEEEKKAVDESQEIAGGHNEQCTEGEEETDERGNRGEKCSEEEKPDKCDTQKDPEEKKLRFSSELWHSLSLSEDTNRAHSTLDDVLQQFEEEEEEEEGTT